MKFIIVVILLLCSSCTMYVQVGNKRPKSLEVNHDIDSLVLQQKIHKFRYTQYK